jgi:hypothetical protein
MIENGYTTDKTVIQGNMRKINLSMSQERQKYDNNENVGYGDVFKVINEINHHLPSETEGSQKSLMQKKPKDLNTSYDNINKITDVVEFQKSPVTDKR